jgi:putative DNA primase/helicase
LNTILADGPKSVSELKKAAEAHSLPWRTIERAKKALGIEAHRSGFGPGGGWSWQLPHRPPYAAIETEQENMAVYDKSGGLWTGEPMVEVEI